MSDTPRESSSHEGGKAPESMMEAMNDGVWEVLSRWRAEGRTFALLTVIETRGFTPQKSGAHMLVDAAGHTFGTVGGGAIEHEALHQARTLIAEGAGVSVVKRHLTQELGMCCGGEMAIHVEVVAAAPRLFVFGAGYIAKPLAALAAGCGFRVTVVDERADWATAERFPGAAVHARAPEDFLRALDTHERDFVVIATHDHALDQRLVEDLLRRPLRFVGMIGSVPKQRKFALRLRARGYSDEQIARLRTPLGLPIGAKSPEEIAVSVMSELIAVRRGKTVAEGWTPPAREERRTESNGEASTAGSANPGAEATGSPHPEWDPGGALARGEERS
jgi:xanthine dehydrogenase accessory factor